MLFFFALLKAPAKFCHGGVISLHCLGNLSPSFEYMIHESGRYYFTQIQRPLNAFVALYAPNDQPAVDKTIIGGLVLYEGTHICLEVTIKLQPKNITNLKVRRILI